MNVILILTAFFVFLIIAIPVLIMLALMYTDKISKFRLNLKPNQTVIIDDDGELRQARIIKSTNSIIYVTMATGRRMAVLSENVYPLNYFSKDDLDMEVNNIKVA